MLSIGRLGYAFKQFVHIVLGLPSTPSITASQVC
jgi:hypothetical protein